MGLRDVQISVFNPSSYKLGSFVDKSALDSSTNVTQIMVQIIIINL